jgi:hypothetical protein
VDDDGVDEGGGSGGTVTAGSVKFCWLAQSCGEVPCGFRE